MNLHLVFLQALLFILLGYSLKKSRILGTEESRSLSKIIMNVTLPALIFRTITKADIVGGLMVLPLAAIVFGLVVCGVLLIMNRSAAPEDKAVYSLGAIGFNNGMFAYPIVEGVFGATGLGYLAIFDIGSGLSVFGASYMLAAYFQARRDQAHFRMTAGAFFRLILKSLPFMTYLVALAWNLFGLPVWSFLDSCLLVPARANMFLVLTLIGLHLEFSLEGCNRRKILEIFGLRYGLGIALGVVLFFTPIESEILHAVLTILFILPVSMAAIPYSTLFSFDTKTAGALVNYSIVISFVLMWLGLSILR